jgi:histidinol phosphatase-like PHP family hydrolase
MSDGELIPIELIRRMSVLGYSTVGITDHVDICSVEYVVESLTRLRDSSREYGVTLLCGVEITHVPPREIPDIASKAREGGADLVVVHGETPVEPVCPGTNHAACLCEEVDILAHPGLISEEEARLAARRGLLLELTARGGHNRTNGHVLRMAELTGAPVIVNSDAHAPGDLLDERAQTFVALGAGMEEDNWKELRSLNIVKMLKL